MRLSRIFAMFFMVLDLRLVKIGCRETINFFCYIPVSTLHTPTHFPHHAMALRDTVPTGLSCQHPKSTRPVSPRHHAMPIPPPHPPHQNTPPRTPYACPHESKRTHVSSKAHTHSTKAPRTTRRRRPPLHGGQRGRSMTAGQGTGTHREPFHHTGKSQEINASAMKKRSHCLPFFKRYRNFAQDKVQDSHPHPHPTRKHLVF